MNARSAKITVAIASLIALLSFAPAVQADPAPNWGEEDPLVTPPARQAAAMAYDAVREEVVLFGGQTENGHPLGDTWTWDGAEWTLESPENSPSPRSGAGLAFHKASGQMILVGGHTQDGVETETWAWDGSTWKELTPATPAPAVSNPSIAYDSEREVVFLFGGMALNGDTVNSTWAWNGTTWSDLAPVSSPPPRWGGPMAYDPENEQMVLFGGIGGTTGPGYPDTWTWDGTTWTEQSPSHAPPLGFGLPMAYSPTTGSVIKLAATFSGETETWGWDGTDWTRVSTFGNPPAPRVAYTLALDEANEKLVLFGGFEMEGQTLADTWTFGVQTDQAPIATVSSPLDGEPLEIGERVPVSFACSAAPLGPPVDTCVDSGSDSSTGTLDTSTAGSHVYKVTATAVDGQTGTASLSYVVSPNSQPACRKVGRFRVWGVQRAPSHGNVRRVPGVRIEIRTGRNVIAKIDPRISFVSGNRAGFISLKRRSLRINRSRELRFRLPSRLKRQMRRETGSVYGNRIIFRLRARVKARGDRQNCFRQSGVRSVRVRVTDVSGPEATRRR